MPKVKEILPQLRVNIVLNVVEDNTKQVLQTNEKDKKNKKTKIKINK